MAEGLPVAQESPDKVLISMGCGKQLRATVSRAQGAEASATTADVWERTHCADEETDSLTQGPRAGGQRSQIQTQDPHIAHHTTGCDGLSNALPTPQGIRPFRHKQ